MVRFIPTHLVKYTFFKNVPNKLGFLFNNFKLIILKILFYLLITSIVSQKQISDHLNHLNKSYNVYLKSILHIKCNSRNRNTLPKTARNK